MNKFQLSYSLPSWIPTTPAGQFWLSAASWPEQRPTRGSFRPGSCPGPELSELQTLPGSRDQFYKIYFAAADGAAKSKYSQLQVDLQLDIGRFIVRYMQIYSQIYVDLQLDIGRYTMIWQPYVRLVKTMLQFCKKLGNFQIFFSVQQSIEFFQHQLRLV